ncbi:hypothetical protein BG000_007259 [Podila horticola]|nr:hypothetical protein BG000_007259 [Podila horticola]
MPASPISTPPPPPPDNDTGPIVAPPPPPPPPEDTSPIPPPPPASEPEEPTKSNEQPVKATEAIEADPKPRRKSRFAPMTQDQSQPLHGNASLSTSNPQKGNTKTQSTSSSSSLSSRDSSSGSSASTTPLTANQWEKTAFVGDASGEKRMKFLKLMGLGKSTKIEAKPDNSQEASQEAAKRQQVLRDMERQYETGRKRRHQLN